MREEDLYSSGVFASELNDDAGDDAVEEKEKDFDEDDLDDDELEGLDEEDAGYNPMDDYQKDGWDS